MKKLPVAQPFGLLRSSRTSRTRSFIWPKSMNELSSRRKFIHSEEEQRTRQIAASRTLDIPNAIILWLLHPFVSSTYGTVAPYWRSAVVGLLQHKISLLSTLDWRPRTTWGGYDHTWASKNLKFLILSETNAWILQASPGGRRRFPFHILFVLEFPTNFQRRRGTSPKFQSSHFPE